MVAVTSELDATSDESGSETDGSDADMTASGMTAPAAGRHDTFDPKEIFDLLLRVASGAVPATALRTVAHPTPMRPCRGSPEINPTTTAISSGVAVRRRSASRVIFSLRARVAATSSVAATRSSRRIAPVSRTRRAEGP